MLRHRARRFNRIFDTRGNEEKQTVFVVQYQ